MFFKENGSFILLAASLGLNIYQAFKKNKVEVNQLENDRIELALDGFQGLNDNLIKRCEQLQIQLQQQEERFKEYARREAEMIQELATARKDILDLIVHLKEYKNENDQLREKMKALMQKQ